MIQKRLLNLRLAKGYSIHMMAGWLEITVDSYLELEFGLRRPNIKECFILQRIFQG